MINTDELRANNLILAKNKPFIVSTVINNINESPLINGFYIPEKGEPLAVADIDPNICSPYPITTDIVEQYDSIIQGLKKDFPSKKIIYFHDLQNYITNIQNR